MSESNLPNDLLRESCGFRKYLSRSAPERAWEIVLDMVDYPVSIVTAYYKDKDGEMVRAAGKTNTKRDNHINLVVVDKFRDGEQEAIAAVTGLYGSVKTKDVYQALKSQLAVAEIENTPSSLYVSGNGGSQQLVVRLPSMRGPKMLPDELTMDIVVNTSVDGSTLHSVRANIHNNTSGVDSHALSMTRRLAARHTTTLDSRTVDFIPSINALVKSWNEDIMPAMNLIFDAKYDHDFAVSLLGKLSEKAGIGERHREKIEALYESNKVRTNDDSDSLYRISETVGQYINDEIESVELQERFHAGFAKQIGNEIWNLRNK